MLVKLTRFREQHYEEGSRPTIRTLKKRIFAGTFPYYCEVQGKSIYVDPERPAVNDEKVNAIVDSVLAS